MKELNAFVETVQSFLEFRQRVCNLVTDTVYKAQWHFQGYTCERRDPQDKRCSDIESVLFSYYHVGDLRSAEWISAEKVITGLFIVYLSQIGGTGKSVMARDCYSIVLPLMFVFANFPCWEPKDDALPRRVVVHIPTRTIANTSNQVLFQDPFFEKDRTRVMLACDDLLGLGAGCQRQPGKAGRLLSLRARGDGNAEFVGRVLLSTNRTSARGRGYEQ